jgi:hypothetical protein
VNDLAFDEVVQTFDVRNLQRSHSLDGRRQRLIGTARTPLLS